VQVNEEDYHSAVGELFSYAGYQRHHKASQPRTQKEQTQAQPGPTPKREQIHPTLYEMPDRNLPPLCLVENYSSLVEESFAREESARAAQR